MAAMPTSQASPLFSHTSDSLTAVNLDFRLIWQKGHGRINQRGRASHLHRRRHLFSMARRFFWSEGKDCERPWSLPHLEAVCSNLFFSS